MVDHSERKCNVHEPQLSLISHNHNFISIILQGIQLLVTSLFPNQSCVGIYPFSDFSSFNLIMHIYL
jgi:hypothetical protein